MRVLKAVFAGARSQEDQIQDITVEREGAIQFTAYGFARIQLVGNSAHRGNGDGILDSEVA
jgi:hypothetical protein